MKSNHIKIFGAQLCILASLFLAACDTLTQLGSQVGLGTPTEAEINSGLKQALEYGTSYASDRLSEEDGYLGNLAIKIAFPEEAKKVENTLRSIGLGSLCDQVITSVNRAAEDAAKEAKPIFINAIKEMSINDVKTILMGDKDAATQYFENKTTTSLETKFKPVIEGSLEKVGATKYWGDVVGQYNKVPLVKKIDPDLTSFVTQKAIDGLFYEIAKEELKIRENVTSRSTLLLQKVFGYADREKASGTTTP